MDLQKVINYHLHGAEKDWLACQHLFENKDYPQCLFWGHIVLEKLLKAIIVKITHEQAPYAHDLVFLASKAGISLDAAQRDSLNEITTFNQLGRYDNEIMGFLKKCTAVYTEKYFYTIKQLSLWLKEYIQNMK